MGASLRATIMNPDHLGPEEVTGLDLKNRYPSCV